MDDRVRSEIKDGALTDDVVVRRVLDGDVALMEILMRRYNQRLFRAVRSIVKDDSQVEDIVQEAYVRAYEHLSQFEGRAKFSTWLTKIAIYEAYARLRRFDHQNMDSISELEEKDRARQARLSRLEQLIAPSSTTASPSVIVKVQQVPSQ